MLWEHWWRNGWLPLTLVFGEKVTLDLGLESRVSDGWSTRNLPVEHQVFVNFRETLLISDHLVESWWQLLLKLLLEILFDLIFDGTHEKRLESIDDLRFGISVDLNLDSTLWKRDRDLGYLKSGNYLFVRKSLGH